jgi:hypothetical protein
MLQSPLPVHLSGLMLYEAVSGADLMQLHARCPQLEELNVRVEGASVAALTNSAAGASAFNAHAWPSSLRSLDLGTRKADPIGLQHLLNALPSSAVGLESLTLSTMRSDMLDLTPLLQLPQLTRLVTRLLEPFQLAAVKQLSGLTDVSIADSCWSAESLRALLLDGSHQWQRLQRINLREVTSTSRLCCPCGH